MRWGRVYKASGRLFFRRIKHVNYPSLSPFGVRDFGSDTFFTVRSAITFVRKVKWLSALLLQALLPSCSLVALRRIRD